MCVWHTEKKRFSERERATASICGCIYLVAESTVYQLHKSVSLCFQIDLFSSWLRQDHLRTTRRNMMTWSIHFTEGNWSHRLLVLCHFSPFFKTKKHLSQLCDALNDEMSLMHHSACVCKPVNPTMVISMFMLHFSYMFTWFPISLEYSMVSHPYKVIQF